MSTQDICKLRRTVVDRKIKRHENDGISVGMFVQKLQHHPFNAVLL